MRKIAAFAMITFTVAVMTARCDDTESTRYRRRPKTADTKDAVKEKSSQSDNHGKESGKEDSAKTHASEHSSVEIKPTKKAQPAKHAENSHSDGKTTKSSTGTEKTKHGSVPQNKEPKPMLQNDPEEDHAAELPDPSQHSTHETKDTHDVHESREPVIHTPPRQSVPHNVDASAVHAAERNTHSEMTQTNIKVEALTPTPEMWFYEQSLRRLDDPKMARRKKAEFVAWQRLRRIESRKWFGLSNARPVANPTPVFSNYSPHWVSNGWDPSEWEGVGYSHVIEVHHVDADLGYGLW